MRLLDHPLLDALPPPPELRTRLMDARREVELLRGLLRLSERADNYRRSGQKGPLSQSRKESA
jgi:hypothetical protein